MNWVWIGVSSPTNNGFGPKTHGLGLKKIGAYNNFEE